VSLTEQTPLMWITNRLSVKTRVFLYYSVSIGEDSYLRVNKNQHLL